MILLLLTFALAQARECSGSAAILTAAAERAEAFDLEGALARLGRAPAECVDTQIPLWYLRGLAAARDAYREGGSTESLAPVRRAMAALQAQPARTGITEIARVVLQAASAAAQSERGEMELLLDHARQLEGQQLDGVVTGALLIPVMESAGDLWLQVHRFEDARRAYTDAARSSGRTRRVMLGLARVAVRVNDVPAACAEYRNLVGAWPFPTDPPELAEARAFLRRRDCQAPSRAPARR
jgi:hypothetical protein